MKIKKATFCSVTRNTKDVNSDILTNTMLKSLIKQCKSFIEYDIVIYDCNHYGGQEFKIDSDTQELINNTKSIKNFTIINNSNREKSGATKRFPVNGTEICWCGDTDHSLNIQYLLDNIECDNFILLDNDIIIKKDIIDFCDDNYITCCKLFNTRVPGNPESKRCMPHIQYINKKMFIEQNMVYFKYDIVENYKHVGKIIQHNGIDHLTYHFPTGSILYDQIIKKNLPMLEIDDNEYCIHYGSGNIRKSTQIDIDTFVTNNIQYWK